MSAPDILPRRGRRVLIYGVAPHVVVVPYYDGRRWRARIYAATLTPEGLLRWCGRIRFFYICYTYSPYYCRRDKDQRNLYYEFRVCTVVSERILDRFVIVRTRSRQTYLRRLHRFINAVAYLLRDNLLVRFAQFVETDAGPFLDSAEEVEFVDVMAPRIEPPCGTRATVRRVIPFPRTYYALRCRCPRLADVDVISKAQSLLRFMPYESVLRYVYELLKSLTGGRIEMVEQVTLEDLELWLSRYAFATRLRGNCVDITRELEWLSRYATYVRSEEFYRRARQLA